MLRHSAESVGTFDRMAVHTYVHRMLIVFITNDTALRMLEYISPVLQNRKFPVSVRVQGCGETGLYTLQGASYTATLWFTLVQGA